MNTSESWMPVIAALAGAFGASALGFLYNLYLQKKNHEQQLRLQEENHKFELRKIEVARIQILKESAFRASWEYWGYLQDYYYEQTNENLNKMYVSYGNFSREFLLAGLYLKDDLKNSFWEFSKKSEACAESIVKNKQDAEKLYQEVMTIYVKIGEMLKEELKLENIIKFNFKTPDSHPQTTGGADK